jgi:nitric oxide reductase activation protein
VVYDSRKDNFQKARQLFPSLQNSGSTPEGLCFKATLDMITECTTEYDTYFINFSDGEPGTTVYRNGQYTNYSGTSAAEHTRRQVQAMREAGVKIMSYFISWDGLRKSSYDSNPSLKVFRSMYGEDAVSVDVNNVTEVLRTLNRLLLKKGT